MGISPTNEMDKHQEAGAAGDAVNPRHRRLCLRKRYVDIAVRVTVSLSPDVDHVGGTIRRFSRVRTVVYFRVS